MKGPTFGRELFKFWLDNFYEYTLEGANLETLFVSWFLNLTDENYKQLVNTSLGMPKHE